MVKTKKSIEVLFAMYIYAKKKFPNFNGSFPMDIGLSFFLKYTNLDISSIDRFNRVWRLLGLGKIEKNEIRFFEKQLKDAIKFYSLEYSESKKILIQEKFLTEKELGDD